MSLLKVTGCGLLAVVEFVVLGVVVLVGLLVYWAGFVNNPGGPSYEELAATPILAETMPGAVETSVGGADPSGGLHVSPGVASRHLVVADPAADVTSWYTARFEAEGWTSVPASRTPPQTWDYPTFAWQKGDLVLSLRLPDRERERQYKREYPPGTIYTLSVRWQPPHWQPWPTWPPESG